MENSTDPSGRNGEPVKRSMDLLKENPLEIQSRIDINTVHGQNKKFIFVVGNQSVKHSLTLNKKRIDPQAVKLVKKLQSHNHRAYLVGGCVRDLLLDLIPKDFDIATEARPRQINRIIHPSYIIGRRFKLVLVKRFGKQYEISTFRTQSPRNEEKEGPITNDNTFGTAQEDAKRRDFTINALFYDPIQWELIDYCHGLKDIKDRVIRMIGDPMVRIQEDPLRMLRALRFAHKTNFVVEESLRQAICQSAQQLELSALPRKREELLKFLRLKTAPHLLWECHDLNLLKYLSPSLDEILSKDEAELFMTNLNRGLECISNMEDPSELFSVILFSLLCSHLPSFCGNLVISYSQKKSLELTMKHELGMYRNEQDMFFQSLEFIRELQSIQSTENLRSRHKTHLLKNQSMVIALTLCTAYQLLPEPDLYFWIREYWDLYRNKGQHH